MKRKYLPVNLFDLIMIAILFVVTAFILSAILLIAIKGMPYLFEAFQSDEIIFALKMSVFTASISTFICILLAIPCAYALTKTSLPFKNIIQLLIELPISLPYIVLGLSLLLLFSTEIGRRLSELGFKVIFSTRGIIIAHIFVNLPFVIRIVRTAFQEVNIRMEFISRMLGATKAKSFLTITLPLAKNQMIGASVLAWSRALGEFGATLMLVGATRMKTETIPTSIYLSMATGETGSAMASAIILLIISALSQLIFNNLNRKKIGERICCP